MHPMFSFPSSHPSLGRADALIRQGGRNASDETGSRSALVRALASLAVRPEPDAAVPGAPVCPLPPRVIDAVLAYVRCHLALPIRVGELARMVGYSYGHFCRGFKASVGLPPGAFVNRLRLTQAFELLHTTSLSIADIAAACGFFDQAHLSRHFRRTFGLTPLHARRARVNPTDPLHTSPAHV